MIRRNARLRREYLYRKSLEGKEREEYERKRKIRQALEGSYSALFLYSPVVSAPGFAAPLLGRQGLPQPPCCFDPQMLAQL